MIRKQLLRFQAPQSQPETPISISQTPCTIKNGVCVPKCSELSEEQLLQGVQCALGKPWRFRNDLMFMDYIPQSCRLIFEILHTAIIKHL